MQVAHCLAVHGVGVLSVRAEPSKTNASEMNNDGLLHCSVQESLRTYPQYEHFFDVVVDFGVLGWSQVQKGFSRADMSEYVRSIMRLLKKGVLYILKVDKGGHEATAKHGDARLTFPTYVDPFFELTAHDFPVLAGQERR